MIKLEDLGFSESGELRIRSLYRPTAVNQSDTDFDQLRSPLLGNSRWQFLGYSRGTAQRPVFMLMVLAGSFWWVKGERDRFSRSSQT